ncbi:MAG TPA: PaaX family transcriptional regulator C-terminal domain-containing protein [Thiolinea sp.]|nr:PaaX family transcriptional regulator C-terminal domain-containing protein [Thiolinea sp.]
MSRPDPFRQAAGVVIRYFAESRPIHANTLILTIYGDLVHDFGGSLWLGSLIRLVQPLGINERLVRTSVFRLAEKGMLQASQVGRRSYYRLTRRGQRQHASAARRIYASTPPAWDQRWRLVLTSIGQLGPEQREQVRRELAWLGFIRIDAGIHAHPTVDIDTVRRALDDLGLQEQVAVLEAGASDPELLAVANRLIGCSFDIPALNEQYSDFIDHFSPVLKAARQSARMDPELCFLVRTLLINRFRLLLRQQPELPAELLEPDALSLQARNLTRALYLCCSAPADAHFLALGETRHGKLTRPGPAYYQRFSAP